MAEAPEKVLVVLDLDHHFGTGFLGDDVMGPRTIAVVTAITRQLEHPVAAVTARSNGMLNLITQRVFPIHASNHYEWFCSSLEEPEELPEGSGTKERAINMIVEKVRATTRLGKMNPVGLNRGIADGHVADILEFLYWALVQARAR